MSMDSSASSAIAVACRASSSLARASASPEELLRTYADNLLGPISEGEGEYGPELLRSLEAFIELGGKP